MSGEPEVAQQTATASRVDATPWAYRLVVAAIALVTVAFLVIMGLFAMLQVFDHSNAADVTAALSSLFGVVGTLVGAYFGIKATSESRNVIESTHRDASNAAQSLAETTANRVTETARQAMEKTAGTEEARRTTEATSTPQLATFMPLASVALLGGLLGLRLCRRGRRIF